MSRAGLAGVVAASRRRGAAALDYYNTVLTLSPTNHWKFDEASGSTFVDAVGGKNLTLHGTVGAYGVSTGFANVGNGINFNGTGYPWRAGTPALTNPGSSGFTLCGFIYLGDPGGLTKPWFCASYSGGHVDPYYTFYLSTQGGGGPTYNYRWAVATTATFTPVDPAQAILSQTVWHHLAFTFSSGRVAKIYHDGSLIYTSSVAGGSMPPSGMSSFAFGTIPALDATLYTPVARYSQWSYWSNTELSAGNISTLWGAR